MAEGIVIVGGCYAAVQVAASARQAGCPEPIRIVSEENEIPYQRPPLSKAFLTAAADASTPLRAASFYTEQKIQLDLGARVTVVDRSSKRLRTEKGAEIGYERLVLAVGSRPRALSLEGAELKNVFVLRTLLDAKSLKTSLKEAQSIAVIGGGFIGLEVAASCAKLGRKVTVIEALPRLMSRALPERLGDWFTQLHRQHGVDVRLATSVAALRGDGGKVRAVRLADGSEIAADVVVAGIGVVPNEELAREAGLVCDNGIVVDRLGRTSDLDIFAAGDCTRHPSHYSEKPLRLESVQNAMDQARAVGTTLAGKETPHDAVPWFWSDQYDVKLQMAGLSAGHDEHSVRGSMEEGKFSIFYLRGGKVIGVDSVNRAADHLLARKLVAARSALSAVQAADASFDLKALAG